jgi:hypothetical protein
LGSRCAFTAKDVAPLKTKFAKWVAGRDAPKNGTNVS